MFLLIQSSIMWPEQNSSCLRVRRREVMMGREKDERRQRKWVREKDNYRAVGAVNEFCTIRIIKLPHYRCITSLWRGALQNKEIIKQCCVTALRIIKITYTRFSHSINVSCELSEYFLKLKHTKQLLEQHLKWIKPPAVHARAHTHICTKHS